MKEINIEAELLNLLKQILPSATQDEAVSTKVYAAAEKVLKQKTRAKRFFKFCEEAELPDLEPVSIAAVRKLLEPAFGQSDITLKPDAKKQELNVEVYLADGSPLKGKIQVKAPNPDGEQEVKIKSVPFPVALETDKELVWMLSKQEVLSPEEAGMALRRVESEFWGSKTGLKLLRDRVEKTFAEFIARVPAGALKEVGIKRHYKQPEPIKFIAPSKTPDVQQPSE